MKPYSDSLDFCHCVKCWARIGDKAWHRWVSIFEDDEEAYSRRRNRFFVRLNVIFIFKWNLSADFRLAPSSNMILLRTMSSGLTNFQEILFSDPSSTQFLLFLVYFLLLLLIPLLCGVFLLFIGLLCHTLGYLSWHWHGFLLWFPCRNWSYWLLQEIVFSSHTFSSLYKSSEKEKEMDCRSYQWGVLPSARSSMYMLEHSVVICREEGVACSTGIQIGMSGRDWCWCTVDEFEWRHASHTWQSENLLIFVVEIRWRLVSKSW